MENSHFMKEVLWSIKESFLWPFKRCAPSIVEGACSRYAGESRISELTTFPMLSSLEIESENMSPMRRNVEIPSEEFYATRSQAVANADQDRNVFPTRALTALEFALRTPLLEEEAQDKTLSDAHILFDMGVILTELGNTEKGVECWTEALAYEPKNTQFLYCLGVLKLRQNKFNEARNLLHESFTESEKIGDTLEGRMSHLPSETGVRFALANAERILGNLEEAERHFVALQEEDTEVKAEVLALLADVSQRKGETGRAMALLAKALELRPHDHSFKKQLEALRMEG